jgi:hypothetical protein
MHTDSDPVHPAQDFVPEVTSWLDCEVVGGSPVPTGAMAHWVAEERTDHHCQDSLLPASTHLQAAAPYPEVC